MQEDLEEKWVGFWQNARQRVDDASHSIKNLFYLETDILKGEIPSTSH
jgi:hypothetical protein